MSGQTSDLPEPNVYRDGRWLVVPLEGAVFPRRCVKTNQPVDAASFAFEGDLLRQQLQVPKSAGEEAADAAAGTLAGGVGQVAVELINKRRLKFNIGLSDERQTRSRQRGRYGLGLAIGGPILGFALGGGLAAAVGQSNETLALTLAFVGVGIGMVLMIIGLVLFGMASMSLLRVIRSDGTYVWLEGAHPTFLATLPESPVRTGVTS
jgi:hypothetical protein